LSLGVCDLNNDTLEDIIMHVYFEQYKIKCETNIFKLNNKELEVKKVAGLGEVLNLVIGDVTGDVEKEIIVLHGKKLNLGVKEIIISIFNGQGKEVSEEIISTNIMDDVDVFLSLAEMDNNNPGKEIVVMLNKKDILEAESLSAYIYVYNSKGETLPGWPISYPGHTGSACIADINNDAQNEIICIQKDEQGEFKINAYTPQGNMCEGNWPKQYIFCGEYSKTDSLSIGDINADNKLDLIFGYAEKVYAITLEESKADTASLEWSMYLSDARYTRNYVAKKSSDIKPTPTPANITDTWKYKEPVITYPNPAKEKITFMWKEKEAEKVVIEIYNLVGERVSVIEGNNPVENKLVWQVKDVAAGIYFYKLVLTVDEQKQKMPIKKVVIIK